MSADMGDGPSIEDVERELRLAWAKEIADMKSEAAAIAGNLPVRTDKPRSVVPYVGATGVTVGAIAAGVYLLGLPVLATAQWGLTFLASAMLLKRMDDVPANHPNGLVRWFSDRVEKMRDEFGVELYGVAGMTTFIVLEIASLSVSEVSLAEFIANPVGMGISWFVSELIESISNMISAFLWWVPLIGAGWQLALAVIAAAWAVLWVLDMPEGPAEDYGMSDLL